MLGWIRNRSEMQGHCTARSPGFVRYRREEFEDWVEDAWDSIPEDIRARFSNLSIVVEDEPSAEHRCAGRVPPGGTLLGLYQGVPLDRRGWHYQMALPDRVTLFQGPIERHARSDVRQEIYRTLWHELAHHLGMNEAEVRAAEDRKFGRPRSRRRR